MNFFIGIVKKIILDESDQPYYEAFGREDSIGTILFSRYNEPGPLLDLQFADTEKAKPLNYHISYYPTPNELVLITSSPSSNYHETGDVEYYYMSPINIFNSPASNAYPNSVDDEGNFVQGKYFKPVENIRPLRPYEGDVMVEGRFGNSIRFGFTIPRTDEEGNINTNHPNNWSNVGTQGNPITIIRNGQAGNEQIESYEPILENINEDNSSIYLCSNQQITNFKPASLHDASYGHDIFKEKIQQEPNLPNDDLETETEEDIPMNPAITVPPKELQADEELELIENNTNDSVAHYDNGGENTENQTIYPNNEVNLPNNYEIPETVDMNAPLGMPIDNTAVSPFTIPGDTGNDN